MKHVHNFLGKRLAGFDTQNLLQHKVQFSRNDTFGVDHNTGAKPNIRTQKRTHLVQCLLIGICHKKLLGM